MRTSRAGLAVAVSVLVAATAPAAATTPDPLAPYRDQQVSWGACPFKQRNQTRTAECARITVPRDWSAPSAGTDLQVAISRAAATGSRQGAILVNPGGPGGRGTSLAGALAGLEPSVNEHYDIIGMDPRGTGQEGGTDEGYVCRVPLARLPQDADDLDARDRSAASIALHQRTPRVLAEACQNDALAPFVTTWQTAHDMDLIRALLGDEKLNYLGFSYGTWLGAKYASLFPDRAGKMVLDSSVNFEGRLQAAFEAFPKIDQRQFDRVYAPWLARRFPEQLGKTGTEVRAKWEKLRAFFKTKGIPPDDFDSVFVGNGSTRQWMTGALVLTKGAAALDGKTTPPPATLRSDLDRASRAVFGRPADRLTAADVAADPPEPDYADVPGTRLAVACGDQPTRTASWYKLLSDLQGPAYPLFGWAYGLSEACGFWSDAPQHELPTLSPRAAKNILVVQGEFDPQTGYEQAEAAARAAGIPMISVAESPFHGQYAVSGNSCVDDLVNGFFLGAGRPAATICPGVPLPGEHQVFPVAGPAGEPSRPTAPAPRDARSTVRERLQDDISAVNRGR
ncbi:alpha/beta fold hydrolase [Amycolatopsis sp. DG1A-15b]|uniref:alpha/beta fold hydrolase n=1 Tax=Amycolatopsis sp. DG1A-15b TaxID=3052846 RepID=UPI00255C04EF|nr:alpha/beta fold hydrolase [Amycolatopsis sp. DG1A-15b]WIX90683.1 alpha/beta fold hydrolase [Amycolatopsis sp. DG1A-15b]